MSKKENTAAKKENALRGKIVYRESAERGKGEWSER